MRTHTHTAANDNNEIKCPALVVSVSNVSANDGVFVQSIAISSDQDKYCGVQWSRLFIWLPACVFRVHKHTEREMKKSPFALGSHNEIFIFNFPFGFSFAPWLLCAWNGITAVIGVYYVISLSVFRSVDINRLSPNDVCVFTSCAHSVFFLTLTYTFLLYVVQNLMVNVQFFVEKHY